MADPRGCVEQTKPLDGEVWTVEVGESKQKWRVHQDLLCKHSAFFRSAVKEEWNHDQTKTIPLTDDDPEVFQVYAQWLYQDKILVQNRNVSREHSRESDKLLKCYVFGEKIQDIVFQNIITDSILADVDEEDENGRRWYPTDADIVYEGTPEGSPLRMLMVDMFVYHGDQEWIKSQRNVDFLIDLAKKLLDIRASPSTVSPVSRKTSSVYHKPVQEPVPEPPSPEVDAPDLKK